MFVIIHTQKICGVLKTGTTVKGSSYVNHIRRFREAVKKKRVGQTASRSLVLPRQCPLHIAEVAMAAIRAGIKILQHEALVFRSSKSFVGSRISFGVASGMMASTGIIGLKVFFLKVFRKKMD